jgi:outer membrane biosynthesis protein TonB
VTVSFTIFSKGNINTPVVRENAGDKNLDSIAVSAIIDSVPFPELPEKLNRSNLKISIIFKYVPEKK